MRTVQEIYDAYRIMPNLQLHQLRVAAVGKMICDHLSEEIDAGDVVFACLFHDMGNILKFDFSFYPEFLQPEGLEHWEGVKEDFLKKYGPDEHAATSAIIREFGLSPRAIALIESVGFSKMLQTEASNTIELKVVEYGDCRVAPYGITSVRERFEDGSKRYAHRHEDSAVAQAHYVSLTSAAYEIERQIFERCSIKPEDINDESAATLIGELRKYPVA